MAVNEQSEVPVSIQFCANCVHEICYRFTVEVYRRLALLTTPTDRAAENQFLLLVCRVGFACDGIQEVQVLR